MGEGSLGFERAGESGSSTSSGSKNTEKNLGVRI